MLIMQNRLDELHLEIEFHCKFHFFLDFFRKKFYNHDSVFSGNEFIVRAAGVLIHSFLRRSFVILIYLEAKE